MEERLWLDDTVFLRRIYLVHGFSSTRGAFCREQEMVMGLHRIPQDVNDLLDLIQMVFPRKQRFTANQLA